jgi:hypothetical protein
MQQSKQVKIRKDFQPLTSCVNLVVRSTASPQRQVYDGETFEPDRGVTPLVIIPEILAKSTDGSWDTSVANKLLAPTSIKWKINGEDVTTLDDWKTLVSIDTTTDGYQRGMITISRNVLPTESFDLQFFGTFTDTRLGVNISVTSEIISLNTVSKAEDSYGFTLGNSSVFNYNVLNDRLFAYDLHRDFGVGNETDKDACLDGKQYLFTMPLNVCHGTKTITSGYSIKLYRLSGDEKEELAVDGLEVIKIGTDEIIIDCRFIDHEEYLIEMVVEEKAVDTKQFSIYREESGYNASPMFSMSIQPSDEYHRNKLYIETDDDVVENPEYYFNIDWYSATSSLAKKAWQTGPKCVVNLADAGVGNTSTDDWLQIWAETEYKGKYYALTDEDGEMYTDEDGDVYIGN